MAGWRTVELGGIRRTRGFSQRIKKWLAGAILLISWVAALQAQPAITNLTPNSATAGQVDNVPITVTGSGFADGAVVVFGSADLNTTFVNETSLTALIPPGELSTPGTVQVKVRNPAPGNEVSNGVSFTITGTPAITNLNPAKAVAGSAGFTLTITGTNFLSGSVVEFDGELLTPTAITETTLQVDVPAAKIATAGTKNVQVNNPGDLHSAPVPFTVEPALEASYPATITGTRGVAITAVMPAISNGTGPFTFALASGTLPQGLAFNQTSGEISGTPAEAGAWNITVKVEDSSTPTQTALSGNITITITDPPLQIDTSSALPGGTAGSAYSVSLAASGGNDGPYHWAVNSGSLPAGLTLADDGHISGTPTAAGAFSFTLEVTDNKNTPVTKGFSLTIVPVILSLNPSNLPVNSVDKPLAITGRGFVGGKTSVKFGNTVIPETSVAISGTNETTALVSIPNGELTTPGPVAVTVTVEGATSAAMNFFVIGDTTITITNDANLGAHTAGVTFTADLEATGGNGNYTWSVAQGSSLPAGLALNATTGVLSGTPSVAGNFNFTIRVVDNADPGQSSGQKTFSLTIQNFVISTATLPQARVGIAYSSDLSFSGGPSAPSTDYQWTLVSGSESLPAGITFDTASGKLSGTPAPIGTPTQTFTLRVSARHIPSGLVTPTVTLQLVVAGGGLDFSITALPLAIRNQAYGPSGTGVNILPVNGTPPYRFEVSAPQTAALAAAGLSVTTVNNDAAQVWSVQVSGSPTTTGSYPLDVTLRDSGSTQVSRRFTVQILASALSIQPETLPAAVVNTPGSQQLSVNGLSPEETTVSWALNTSVTGITLNPSTGFLTWNFSTSGLRTFTVQATTSLREVTRVYRLDAGSPRPSIVTSSLPPAPVGQDYNQLVTATGGTPGYTWQLTGGTLPVGLNFDTLSQPDAARIVGTPSPSAQTQTFTLTVRDTLGQTASREFTIAVTSTPTPAITLDSFTNAGPSEQKDVVVRLAQPYPVELKGVVTLSFTPNATVNSDDPKVLFLNGSRTASFTIPANSTLAIFDGVPTQRVQTGTTAGTVRVQAAITGGGPSASQEFTIARIAPFIEDNLSVQTSSGGFTVILTGYSTPRDLSSARVVFTPTAGTNLQTTELNIPLSTAAQTWFESASGQGAGSAFKLTIPFTVQGGTNAVASVTVTLTNSVGTSNSRTRAF